MNRRLLASALAIALVVPVIGAAQVAGRKVPRIAYLSDRPAPTSFEESFRQGLRDHGYIEGQTIIVEYRWADGSAERLASMAADLVALKVDVIAAQGTPAILAAKRATTTIPIVMVASPDAVGLGLVATLARPGGNLTGQSTFATELAAKRLQVFKEAIPGLSRVGALYNATNPGNPLQYAQTEAAARQLGLEVHRMEARFPDDLEAVFAAAAKSRVDGVTILSDGATIRHRADIASIAAKHRIPTIFANKNYLEGGGLMSYGPNILEVYWRSATHVDKILKGANPAELPVEQPSRFELVINLRAAHALGIVIPSTVLRIADEVIE